MVWETKAQQNQLIASEFARTKPEHDLEIEFGDWTESFDDLDGNFWENHLGGPDDCDQTDYESFVYEDYEQGEAYDEELGHQELGSIKSRLEEIAIWLSRSRFAKAFVTNNGFFVSKGHIVRLKNGKSVELVDWLRSEGIIAGTSVVGYKVVYSSPDNRWGEKLSFFNSN